MPWLITVLERDGETSVPTSAVTGGGAHITLGVRGCLLDLLILTPLALFSERSWKQLISKPGRHPKSTWVNLGQGTCLQLFEDVYLFILLN